MRIGIVCSSGGGAFAAGIKLLRDCGYQPSSLVVTDRPCGAEDACDHLDIQWKRIEDSSRQGFSKKAAEWLFDENNVDWVCLFFSRLVSEELFSRAPCVNIHPSLLPAYPGIGAVRKAMENKSLFLGATAHLTDASMDAGPILGQVVAPISHDVQLDALERLSFAQKVYLFLVSWEMGMRKELISPSEEIYAKRPVNAHASPCLHDKKLELAFDSFLKKEGIEWFRS